jgi:hypothetical protein
VAENAAELTVNNHFWFKNAPNQRFCYNFGDKRIRLTYYSIQTQYNGKIDGCYPKSWVIEISRNCSVCEEVDWRENESVLKGRNLTQLFEVLR